MTCIVGISVGGRVVMGGDSAGVGGWDLTIRADEKVFRNGPFVMGFTSSFRMGQLLRYRFVAPTHERRVEDLEYMSTAFIDAARECLKAGGWKKVSDERESGGTFLVGYKGSVYYVGDDFQVGMSTDGYLACGCGSQAALGALHALSGSRVGARKKVRRALEAAESLSAGVRAPFLIIDSGRGNP